MKYLILIINLLFAFQIFASECSELVRTLLKNRDLTRPRELIVETSIDHEFYLDAQRLGISNRKGLIKVKVIADSELGKPYNEIDIKNWNLTLQRSDKKSNKKYVVPISIAEEYGIPVSTVEDTFYKPVAGDLVGVLIPLDEKKWPLVRFSIKELEDEGMEMKPRLGNGVFLKNVDDENALVRFYNNPEYSHIYYELIVPHENIVNLPTMNSGILKRRLDSFMQLEFSFKKGELVRYRNNGELKVGRVMSESSERFIIKNSLNSKIEMARKDQIFKWVDDANAPKTSANTNEMTELRFHPELSQHTVRALDAIGKLTSTKEFNSMTKEDQVKMLTSFTVGLINYDMKVAKGYNFAHQFPVDKARPFGPELDYPGVNFDFCITSGIGVCRHIAPFLAMALRETGFSKVRVVTSESIDMKDVGHAWVELMMDGTRYIVDPSNQYQIEKYLLGEKLDESQPSFFMKFEDVKKKANSFDLRHYLRKGNEHFPI